MNSFFFYDLETSGFSPRFDRIMQFAGQRTNMKLEPVGEPVNILVKMTDDILPSPGAILTTHITPQATLADGISEPEFCDYFLEKIARPDTIMVGYNNVRFDDEFIRHTLWRNFHDPYEWSWSDGRSRWDLLDVTRFVRALRPDGINWPFSEKVDDDGKAVKMPTVNLVDMAKNNGFENQNAHDALADVNALISLGKLLREKQPKMWGYLLEHRSKASVAEIVQIKAPKPFVYTSGRFPSHNEKTTVAIVIGDSKNSNSALIWDLRFNVGDYVKMTEREISANLAADYQTRKQPDFIPLPVKEIGLNKCPAVAPIGTLDEASQKRINLSMEQVQENLSSLRQNIAFAKKVVKAWLNKPEFAKSADVEGRLYDSFIPDEDKINLRLIAAANENDLADLHPQFIDERLSELLFRYKARNYPKALSESEQQKWESFRASKLTREIPKYMAELAKLASSGADDYILQELQLWAESIVPIDF